jgi:hypothetical protein
LPAGDPIAKHPSSLYLDTALTVPSRSSSKNLKVTIPWTPPGPDASTANELFRPVPPYFHPVPIAPTYPDTLRCVPDFNGGQRCR